MAPTQPDLEATKRVRILLIDDDEDDYCLTRDIIADIPGGNYHLDWISDFDEAQEAICRQEHDVYLVDFRLGAKSGLDLLAAIRQKNCSGPVILLTGLDQPEVDRAAEAAGAADFIVKSQLHPVLLERAFRYTLRQYAQERDLERIVAERTAELIAANQALAELNRRKDEYLATLAHELRNPLAPIRNALEIMRLSAGRPNAVEKARHLVERQIVTLVRLIDDLLDVSRFTRDRLTLSLEPLDLSEPLAMAIETAQPLMDRGRLNFNVDLPLYPLRVQGDRVRLAQVFGQLLANASKYTEPMGTVSLTVERQNSYATIQVTDTGVGIPPDQLHKVFDLFCQVDRSLGRTHGGLGIGLAFVRKLARMHNGDVTARSAGTAQGATFTVTLPLLEDPMPVGRVASAYTSGSRLPENSLLDGHRDGEW